MTPLSARDKIRLLDEYTEAFAALAKEDGVDVLPPNKLRATLSRHSIEDIERVYDVCCRFGMTAMMMTNKKK